MKEKLPLFKRILDYIALNSNFTNAVYISPAQRLRNEADKIEQQDRDIQEFRELIKELESN